MASVETMRMLRLIYSVRKTLTVHLLVQLLVEHHSSVVDGAETRGVAVQTAIALEIRRLVRRHRRVALPANYREVVQVIRQLLVVFRSTLTTRRGHALRHSTTMVALQTSRSRGWNLGERVTGA